MKTTLGMCRKIAASTLAALALTVVSLRTSRAQTRNNSAQAKKRAASSKSPDLRTQPTLYLVGYAHLDTQWRWEYPQVISEYLPDTMHKNFALFEKYPHYIFNWTGANRYMMMKEYFPADYAKVKHYVATGQWFPAGSSMEENDVNSPSPESIIRQVLYGNEFFRREFGKASEEYMLPDCFGFPSDLPSILAAAGVKGFSTQKLTWGSSANVGGPNSIENTPEGTPFNVGLWIGPDGHGVIAALNPESYDGPVHYDLQLTVAPAGVKNFIDWPARVNLDGEVSTAYADYHYYGTGDIGGAPDEESVRMVEQMTSQPAPAVANPVPKGEKAPPEPILGEKPLRIVSSDADQMFKDILAQNLARNLPKYRGDLELTNHSAGSLTSEAVHKHWNRENENLARAAEEASVGAAWLGGHPYPLGRINHAWRLVLGGQFHDIMAGTATPKAYEYSWNDDVIAMNQFAGVLTSAVDSIASQMDTGGKGAAIIVYNPLSIAREDVVEANVQFDDGSGQGAVKVFGPDGNEVISQVEAYSSMGRHSEIKLLFLAKLPSVGFSVYRVEPAAPTKSHLASATSSELEVSESGLENARYRVAVNSDGDVTSIYDKKLGRELLSAPMRLAFQTEKPSQWPAWNMDWDDQSKLPRGYVSGPAKISIVEKGPVRVALRIEREAEGSKFFETIRLAAGDAGNRVEFANAIDWKTREAALKAVFPLTASNANATYNWGAGTIQRPIDNEKTFEMASHRWFDLTDKSGGFGVTILSGAKTGSDRPDDHTLRLTLIYTPGISPAGEPYRDQATQDWGHHEFVYGLASHANDWSQSRTRWEAYRLDDPLIAFEASNHRGALGKTFSLLRVSNNDVRVMALKRAEAGDSYVVRLVEMTGKPERNVRVSFAAPVISAQQIDGQERPLARAAVADGALDANFEPYEIRSYEVKLAAPQVRTAAPRWRAVTLPYNLAAASNDGTHSSGGFDSAGDALPAEMLPSDIPYAGIHFQLAPSATGKQDAVIAQGQTISLPEGSYNRIYILGASADGDQQAEFHFGSSVQNVTMQNWTGYVGQWFDRSFVEKPLEAPPAPDPNDQSDAAQRVRRLRARIQAHGPILLPHFASMMPGFIKRAPIAWFASHHHTAEGANTPYSYCYLFAYSFDLPAGARSLTLPQNDKIRIMAVTVANESSSAKPAQPLYDTTAEIDGKAAQSEN